jgi:hypothetical protein
VNVTRLNGLIVASVWAMASAAGAYPLHIAGSFTGIASVQQLPLNFPPPHPMSYYEGATVTGRFDIQAPNPQPVSFSDRSFYNQDGWLSVSFNVRDQNFSYVVGPAEPPFGYPSVMVLNPPQGVDPLQSVAFATDWTTKYQGAQIGLSGPAGSLFDGIDVTTLHVDPAQPLGFFAAMADSAAELRMTMQVSAFDVQVVNDVPEPDTRWLAAAGLLALVVALRAAPHRPGWLRRAARFSAPGEG